MMEHPVYICLIVFGLFQTGNHFDNDSTSQYDEEVRALVALDELGLHDERRDVVDGVAAFGTQLKWENNSKVTAKI